MHIIARTARHQQRLPAAHNLEPPPFQMASSQRRTQTSKKIRLQLRDRIAPPINQVRNVAPHVDILHYILSIPHAADRRACSRACLTKSACGVQRYAIRGDDALMRYAALHVVRAFWLFLLPYIVGSRYSSPRDVVRCVPDDVFVRPLSPPP